MDETLADEFKTDFKAFRPYRLHQKTNIDVWEGGFLLVCLFVCFWEGGVPTFLM